MAAPPFTGVGVALVTLFDDTGALDTPATAELAARLVDLGVRAVVVAGSTGEAATLDRTERIELLDAVRAAVTGVPVIAGTGAPSAHQAARFTRDACDHGADAVLVLSPPGDADQRAYYDTVRSVAGRCPVLAYHFPRVSSPGIPVGTLPELPIAGLKDSSGDARRLLQELTTWNRPLYTGAASLLALGGPAGCAGAILSLANVDPEHCSAAFDGDLDAQRALAEADVATHERFPLVLKERVAKRFGTSTTCRAV
ncbi:MAG TPA: dihydrodipicolinate synthase family protein [Acidimicrobiia bacterium]|nr:dihydrodipicolinate synthase family protein [Acidimicrobiia bacterium]